MSRLRPLTVVFVVLASPLLVFEAILMPPGYSPDEPAHAARAESLLHGAILGLRGETTGPAGTPVTVTGVWADPAIAAADVALPPSVPKVITGDILKRLLATPWSPTPAFVPSAVTPYFPAFYLPSAVGIAVARLVGAPPLMAIYAGRLASAAAFVLVGALALSLARRGTALLFTTLMLPLTVWLAASLNQDGLMIAMACLVVALLTQVELAGPMDAGLQRGWAAVGLSLILLAKPPYLPLAAFLLLPFESAGRGMRVWTGRAVVAVLAAVPALGWSVLLKQFVAGELPMQPYVAGPLYPGPPGTVFSSTDMAAQLQVIIESPSRLFSVLVISAIQQLPGRVHQMINEMGLLNVSLPEPVYIAWLLALVAAILAAPVAPAPGLGRPLTDWLGRIVGIMAVLGCVLLVYLALYLSWTKVGLDHVEGVQGRYYLPLLPFLVICRPRYSNNAFFTRVAVAPAMILATAGVVLIPLLIVRSFYIP